MIPFAILLLPILEIATAISAIRMFGFTNAFFAWLIGTILGIGLLRSAGARVSFNVAQAARRGQNPGPAALEGALLGLAGGLLVIPGFLSDVLGYLLLVPPIRKFVARKFAVGFTFNPGAAGGPFQRAPKDGVAQDQGRDARIGDEDASHAVIDVDAVVVDESRRQR